LQSIVYTGPCPGVEAPDGTEFPLGVAVDVDDDALAASLLNQACFLTAADYAAQQASANSVPQSDVTTSDTTVTQAPVTGSDS
jgi:hypothetical protein